MRIAVPTYKGGLDDLVCDHFGRAETFTIYDTETGKVEVVRNRSEHFGGFLKPPEILRAKNVDVVLCNGMGVKAIAMFKSYGIRVYMGASGTVRDAIKQFMEGRLFEADESAGCPGHHHHWW